VTVNIANFASNGTAHVYQLANQAITQLADTTVTSGAVNLTVPPTSVTLLVLPPATTTGATHFVVTAPSSATAGAAFNITVTAETAANAVATTYAGTVHFRAPNSQGTLPADTTLTAGAGTFAATLTTTGGQVIDATDTVTTSITGASPTINIVSPGASRLVLLGPASATAGVPLSVTVKAEDVYGNVVTTYSGLTHFTSSDPQASLPTNRFLTGGIATLPATLGTAGAQTITATDAYLPVITGTSGSIAVSSNGASHFVVSAPASATAGAPFTITVTATDAWGNPVPTYGGLIHFTSSDPQAGLPTNRFFGGGGVQTFPITLGTGGSQTITVNDIQLPVITGTSPGVAVGPNGASHFVVSAPSSAKVGQSFSVTITAKDSWGNVVPTYGGLLHFSSSDAKASLPSNRFFSGGTGVASFSAALGTSGSQTISANDVQLPVITGTSSAIVASP
jgi:predicted secreted protein